MNKYLGWLSSLATLAIKGRPYINLAWLIYKRLSHLEGRQELLATFTEALQDGQFSTIEWTKLGHALGVFDANNWEEE